MKALRMFVALLVTAFIVGCGGGGSSGDEPTVAAAAVPPPNICLHGNSVLRGSYVPTPGNVVRSQWAPAWVLAWDGNYPNAVIRDYSVDGEAIWGMRASANWPRQGCDVDVLLHYHNDGHDMEAQINLALSEMTAPKKIVVIANLPTLTVNPAWAYIFTNAEIAKRVALERGVKLCDANLGVNHNHPDGIHPNDGGYAILSGTIVRCLKEEGV